MMANVNLQYRKKLDVLSKVMTDLIILDKIRKRIGDFMSYDIIFNDMIDSLRMAEIKLYEYSIIKERKYLVKD